MKKLSLNDWIEVHRMAGYWVTCCPSCGDFYAQLHRGRTGRRSITCDRQLCIFVERWRRKYGREPPQWLRAKWTEEYGEQRVKRHEYPRRSSDEQPIQE